MAEKVEKKKSDPLAIVKNNYKLILLAIISLVIFNKYIIMIVLMIILGSVGVLTLRLTRMVPHISIETVTASAILIGYLWDWKVGLIFGIGAGMIGYVKVSLIKLTTITNALFMGMCGVLADLFHDLGFGFYAAFLITFFIRMNLGFLVFRQLNPDLTENILHSYGDGLFNVLIVVQFMRIIYAIVVPFI